MRHPLLWLVVGIALGAIAMHLLGTDDLPEPPRPDLRLDEEARGEKVADEAPAPTRRIRTSLDAGEETVRRSIEDLVARLPITEGKVGEGRIDGRVLDQDGQALEGVLVRATPLPGHDTALRRGPPAPWTRWDEPNDSGLAPRIHEIIAMDLWRQTERREARSDGEGRFILDGLGDQRYMIKGWRRGFEVTSAPGTPPAVRAGQVVNLVASRLVDVVVEVTTPDGRPATEASIEISQESRELGASPVPFRGEAIAIPLAPGDYELRATVRHPVEMRSKIARVSLSTEHDAPTVALQLAPHLKLSGRLVFLGRPPDDRLFVTCRSLAPGQSASDLVARSVIEAIQQGALPMPETMQHAASAMNEWRYEVPDLQPGSYAVEVGNLQDPEPLLRKEVVIEDAAIELDLEIPALDLGPRIAFRLIGPGDVEVGDATVMLQPGATGVPRGFERARPERDEDGRLVYAASLRDAGANDPWVVVARSKRFGTLVEKAGLGSTSELTLRFATPASLRVTVPGARENSERGRITVFVQRWDAGETELEVPVSKGLLECDEEDALGFGPLQPGRYWVSAQYEGETFYQPAIGEAEVHLASGMNHQILTLAKMQSLAVRFPSERAGQTAQLRASRGSSFGRGQPIPESGKVVFTGLTEGRYLLYDGELTDASVMEITIPGPSEISFSGRRVDALRVFLDAEEGLLHRAGFEEGDLIIGIGAGDLGANPMGSVLAPLMSGAEVSCRILRGGRERTLKVKLDLAQAGQIGLGGEFILVARPR